MREMYKILAWVGWCWFAIAGAYLLLRLRTQKLEPSSTEATRDE